MSDDNNPAASNHPRPSGPPSRSKEETARLGDEIYESHIRHQVEADHHGEVVAIDVETGSWAIAEDEVAATDRLLYQPRMGVTSGACGSAIGLCIALGAGFCGTPNDRGRG